MVTLYTLPLCPRCNEIKEILDETGHPYLIKSMEDAEALTEMRFDGCYEVVAPVVKMGDKYFTYDEFMSVNKKEE